jgi:hypothetical protein
MKCKCGFETEEIVAVKHGCLMCGDKDLVNKERLIQLSKGNVECNICYKGKCQGLKQWAIDLDINYSTLNGRKWRGLSTEEMFKK